MESFLRINKVCEKTGLSKATIYNRVKEGSFPSPIPLGPQARAWIESEIASWIQKQIYNARVAS